MKKTLIGLAGLLTLLMLAVVAAPLLIPTDLIRARLTQAVRAATGRELRIDGPIRLHAIPSLRVTAASVSFANAPGAATPDMVKIKSLEVDLRTLPLLNGRVEFARLLLTEPEFNLEVAPDGRANWRFDAPAKPEAAPTTTSASRPATPPSISLDDVRIESGRATFRDRRANTTQSLDHIGIHLSLPGLEKPFSATGTATWNGEAVNLTFNAADPGALLAGRENKLDLKLAAAPLTVSFAGTISGLPPQRITGAIDVASPSLRRLAAWAGRPIAGSGTSLGPLAIKGKIAAAGPDVAFTDATITLDAATATGDLKLATGGPRLALSGNLAAGVLDLNPYFPETPAPSKDPKPTPAPPSAAPATQAEDSWSDTPIDLASLRLVDTDLTLSAEQLVLRKLRIDKPGLRVQLHDGKLHTDLPDITVYRGRGKATLDIDAAGPSPTLAVVLTLAGADIEPLLDATIGLDRLAGTGNIDADLKASGASQRALIASLEGKGAINIVDGQIKGVDLLDIARSAIPGGRTGQRGGSTPFGTLTGTFRIEAGILRNDDLQLKSGLVPATGAGTVNLPARTIDYRAVPQLAGALKIPIRMTGPWNRISYHSDGADSVRGIVQQPGTLLRRLLPRP